jgi:hypothetical protein
MNLVRASEKIASLTNELARSIEAKMEIDAIESPVDRIFNDLLQNHNRSPDGTRYSRDTLIWARQVYDASPIAWIVVRKMLPFRQNGFFDPSLTQSDRLSLIRSLILSKWASQ